MNANMEDKTTKTANRCASCGVSEGDDVELKKCGGCKSVHYCSITCQKEHRPKHKHDCKKRAAELREELLFRQPESSHSGDCPICCLPHALDGRKIFIMTCCSKSLCAGCTHANDMREYELGLEPKCPFCRQAVGTPDITKERRERRAAMMDPVALRQNGLVCYKDGDVQGAFENLSKAAELGDAAAHFQVGFMYYRGDFVRMNYSKHVRHMEEAAIGGHPHARHELASLEVGNLPFDKGAGARAAKHLLISTKLGYEESMKSLKLHYEAEYIGKEDYDEALREYKVAVDATKSPQREEAYIAYGIEE